MNKTWSEHIAAGMAALNASDYAAAQVQFDKALDDAKDCFDHTDNRIPQTLSFIGHTSFCMNDAAKAEAFLKQAVKINASLATPAEVCTGMDLLVLGVIERARGKLVEADAYTQDAIPWLEQSLSGAEVIRLLEYFGESRVDAEKDIETTVEKPPESIAVLVDAYESRLTACELLKTASLLEQADAFEDALMFADTAWKACEDLPVWDIIFVDIFRLKAGLLRKLGQYELAEQLEAGASEIESENNRRREFAQEQQRQLQPLAAIEANGDD